LDQRKFVGMRQKIEKNAEKYEKSRTGGGELDRQEPSTGGIDWTEDASNPTIREEAQSRINLGDKQLTKSKGNEPFKKTIARLQKGHCC